MDQFSRSRWWRCCCWSLASAATLIASLVGLGFASANYCALTQAASPASLIGRVIGYQNTVANLAGICAPMLTGFLVGEKKNFSLSILFAGGSLLIAATACRFLVREKDSHALKHGKA